MAVKEILDDRVIDLNMDAKNKDEVIRHLAGLLKNAGYIEDLEGYVRDVYVRESEGITGIGGHVAIPHGKSDHVDHVGIDSGPHQGYDRLGILRWGAIPFVFPLAVPSPQ